MPGANQSGGRVFVSGSYLSAVSVSGLTETRLDSQANTGIGTLYADSSASVLAVGGCGVPASVLGGSNVFISDCWFEGTRSNLFDLESGTLTFLGGLLAPYSDGYAAGLSKSAAAVAFNDFTGQASFIGVSLNLRTGSNGILVNSASAATQALFLGMSSNASGFFTNDVASDAVGAVFADGAHRRSHRCPPVPHRGGEHGPRTQRDKLVPCHAPADTNGRSRIHFVTAHFSPWVTGAPACSDAGATWPRPLQYSK